MRLRLHLKIIALPSTLLSLAPAGFERLSQRLQREAGFSRVTVTGKSVAGGIDGFGTLQINPFVSMKVLFQCKRYGNSVTPSNVRDFRGAMSGRAGKGIIITSGTFASEAKKEAARDGTHSIELIDGEKLIEMLERLELGLKPITTFEGGFTLPARSSRTTVSAVAFECSFPCSYAWAMAADASACCRSRLRLAASTASAGLRLARQYASGPGPGPSLGSTGSFTLSSPSRHLPAKARAMGFLAVAPGT